MDRDRIRRAAEGRATARAGAETRRMAVYGGLIVVLAIALSIDTDGDEGPQDASEPLGYLDEPAERIPTAVVDRDLLAAVLDGDRGERAYLEPEARKHLVDQARRLVYPDLETLGLREASWDALTADPASQRGDAVFMIGTLRRLEKVEGRWPGEWSGEVEDEDGRSWNVLVASPPERVVALGDPVKVAGFFLKWYDAPRADGSVSSGPLIIGEELVRSFFRIDPVTESPTAALSQVRDYDIASASRPLESDPVFFELLSYALNTEYEDLFDPAIPIEQYQVIPVELLANSGLYRGKPVRVYGRLLHMQERPLGPRGENSLGIPFYWQVWIDNQRGGVALGVVTERPDGVELGDIVDLDGVFYRRYAYENRSRRPINAAVVIVDRLSKFEPAPDTLTPMLVTIVLVLAGGVALMILVGNIRDRKVAAVQRHKRMGRLRANVARPGRLHDGSVSLQPTGGVVVGPLPGERMGQGRTRIVRASPRLPRLLADLAAERSRFVVVDENVARLHPDTATLSEHVFIVPAGEEHKNWEVLGRLLAAMEQADLRRDGVVLGIGGGVTTDLAGLAAALHRRGVAWIAVPTTVVGQVDAAYGGKTAVNLGGAKNTVGTFLPPESVWIDTAFLGTLPERERRAGLAEMWKTGCLAGETLLERVEALDVAALGAGNDETGAVIEACLRTKASLIVARDPADHGVRRTLNLGHTFGHAFEALVLPELLHGEAVGLGMLCAARLAAIEHLGTGGAEAEAAIPAAALEERLRRRLEDWGLPVRLPESLVGQADRILELVARDKKATAAGVPLILPRAPGQVDIVEGLPPEALSEALAAVGEAVSTS